MADSNVVKAFRARLRSRGYTKITIECVNASYSGDWGQLLDLHYYVSVAEPLSGRQVDFVVSEQEMNGLLRKVRKENKL